MTPFFAISAGIFFTLTALTEFGMGIPAIILGLSALLAAIAAFLTLR